MGSEPFRVVSLDADVVVSFYDQSNRYFGDFHRVRVVAEVVFPVTHAQLPDDLKALVPSTENQFVYTKPLERMAVPSGHLPVVTEALMDDFLTNVRQYLLRKGFMESLLRRRFQPQKTS